MEKVADSKANLLAPIAAILGGVGVVLGALGAHSLEKILSPQQLDSFETGVRYQLIHALALLALGLSENARRYTWTGAFWISGTLLFSGSIYVLSALELSPSMRGVLGPITPLGGLLLIAGWFGLAIKLTWTAKR